MKRLWGRAQGTRAWRAWKRYGDARGNVLAAGVGYFAFFSIFPAVALAFSVFGFVLQGHPEWLSAIAKAIEGYLPGFVKDSGHPNGIIPVHAPSTGTLTVTGVLAFVTLVLAGLGWLGATRAGIRAVFGVTGEPGNLVTNKLRDLGVLVTLGAGIAVSALLTTVVGAATGWIARHVGLGGSSWVVALAGLVVGVAADTGLMLLLLRFLSGVHVPWRALRQGALVGGVGLTLLKLTGSALIGHVSNNPLFTSIAIVVGLLFWLNLIARLTLIAAAWAANDAQLSPLPQPEPLGPQAPPAAAAGRDLSLPAFGPRTADRATLAAGAVLGATAAFTIGAAGRGIRAVAGFARR